MGVSENGIPLGIEGALCFLSMLLNNLGFEFGGDRIDTGGGVDN
jgi:hypothetical protein